MIEGVQSGDQPADLRRRGRARSREPLRRDAARERQRRSDVSEEVVPHAGVRRRVQCGQELGQRWVVGSHRAFAGGTREGGRTKAWASGARPFKASKQIAMSRAQQRIE